MKAHPIPLFKFTSTCIDDESSDWLASYGDVNTYNFLATRPIQMEALSTTPRGTQRVVPPVRRAAAPALSPISPVSARWDTTTRDSLTTTTTWLHSSPCPTVGSRPLSSKSIGNRIATFTGGTTQGLVNDPGNDDHLSQLNIPNIFQELDQANVSWKIYYTVTDDLCLDGDDCSSSSNANYPATDF